MLLLFLFFSFFLITILPILFFLIKWWITFDLSHLNLGFDLLVDMQFKDPINLRVIKLLFVRLLEEVYFETERKSENIDLDQVIWQILELFLHEVRTVFRVAQARQQKLESFKPDDKEEGMSPFLLLSIVY